MPGTSELNRERNYQTGGEVQANQPVLADVQIPPKDSDPNPRPNEEAYGYVNEGPVSPEQLRATYIAQIGINLSVLRHGEIHTRQN